MAYDQELAERIAALLGERGIEIDERKMFGGLGFMVGGNMGLAAGSGGGIMVRVDPGSVDELLSRSDATVMEMGGRTMAGWVRVEASHLEVDEALGEWIDVGIARARSLPPK